MKGCLGEGEVRQKRRKGWRTVVLMDSEKFAKVRKCRTADSKM